MDLRLIYILLMPFIGALAGHVLGRKNEDLRNVFYDVLTGAQLVMVALLYKDVVHGCVELSIPKIMGTGLYLKVDMMRFIFMALTSLVWFLATIYSTQYLIKYKNRNRYYTFFILTLGSTLGIFMSENILNLFTFFEIMAFTSYILVIHDEDRYAHEAGKSYLVISIASGMITLMGIFLLFDYTGTLVISDFPQKIHLLGKMKLFIGILISIGFAVKASLYPFHTWLPKAYPAAPTPATAILSGILAKAGVYGLMVVSIYMMKGEKTYFLILVVLSMMSMFWGGLLAIFQRNMKRILAYSSMSQIGYIILAIGLMGLLEGHEEIAIYSAVYHSINHGIFKVLLFMVAGVVYMICDDLSLNSIRGFGRHKKLIKLFFAVGMLGVMGIPGFNGFASKNMVHHALVEAIELNDIYWLGILEPIFIIASSFTTIYLMKIFVGVFIDKNEIFKGQYKGHVKKRALFSMTVLAGLTIAIGLMPEKLLDIIKIAGENLHIGGHGEFTFEFYAMENVKSSMMSFGIGLASYLILVRKHLIVKDGSGVEYINPSLKWVSLEDDIYNPMSKKSYDVLIKGFHVVDRGLVGLVKYTVARMKEFTMFELKHEKLKIQGEDRFKNISEVSKKCSLSLNSINNSVYIIGCILVSVMIILIMR